MPGIRYKNLREKMESPEYIHLIELIRQGEERGILEAIPPLPKQIEESNG